MAAAKINFNPTQNIQRVAFTKIGYPIIEITTNKKGKVKQRIIGYTGNPTQYTDVDTYEAILTDSESGQVVTKFEVTRDAFAVKQSDYGATELILSNFAFEPKNADIDNYSGKFMEAYPYKPDKNDTPAIKLTQYGSEVMHAHANQDAIDLGYRNKIDVAAGIMIHVGGYYNNETYGSVIAASEGCFGVVNSGNSQSNPSDSETIRVMSIISDMSIKSNVRPNYILIKLRKRDQNAIPNKITHTRTH